MISAQYNLDSAQSDIDSVIRTLGRVSSPSILVGHSYGGAVITGAGIDDRVVGLVYIAAVAPDEDETAASQQAKVPDRPTCSDRSRSQTAGSGCSHPASGTSAEICLKRSSRSCGRRRRRPPRTCSLRSPQEPPGGRSRALSSWPRKTTRPPRPAPGLCQADGRHDLRGREQPRAMLSHPDVVLDAIRNLVSVPPGSLATA